MSQKIPIVIADLELQLATAIAAGGTSFDISSNVDDDGVTIPNGKYCFTVDNGSSAKEYFMGDLTGTTVSNLKSVSRQGVETTGAVRAHRVGASVILTDFATIQRVGDILRGALTLDGASPLSYDTTPTLSDGKELATVAYVLSVVTGGTVNFSVQSLTGLAGEALAAGDVVYLKESDQRWWKADADDAATVNGVRLGVNLATAASGGAACTVQLSGPIASFSGLTPGSKYYVSNTAGGVSSSAGTASMFVGTAISATTILWLPNFTNQPTANEKAAMAGGGGLGTPSGSNKYQTETGVAAAILATANPVVRVYSSNDTWSKPAGIKYVKVKVVAAGGGVGTGTFGGAGGSGGYSEKLIAAASLGSTETVTVGAVAANSNGGNSSFGAHATTVGGSKGNDDPGSGGATGGGAAGTAASGDINVSGQIGQATPRSSTVLGGRGGAPVYLNYGRGYDASGGITNGTAATNGVVIVEEYYA